LHFCAGVGGDFHSVDRISRSSIVLRNPCLALYLAMPPHDLQQAFVHKWLLKGGFLARCLVADSGLEIEYEPEDRPIVINPAVAAAWSDHIKRQLQTFRFASSPYTPRVEPEVYETSRNFHNVAVGLVKGPYHGTDAASLAMRWNELAWHVALNLHSGAYGENCVEHPLTAETFERAMRLMGFFVSQQQKLLERMKSEADEKELLRLQALIMKKGPISLRDLEKNHSMAKVKVTALVARYPETVTMQVVEAGPEGGRPSSLVRLTETPEPQKPQNP
jgi:hypothetical protein